MTTNQQDAMEAAELALNEVSRPHALYNADEATRACIAVYLAARGAEGWVMVPVEPTQEMKRAGTTAPCDVPISGGVVFSTPDEAAAIYDTMLAARPTNGDS